MTSCKLDKSRGGYVPGMCATIFRYFNVIPYSGKVWRGESLANLVNRL